MGRRHSKRMSIFRWTAPLFKVWGRRWREEDFRHIAGWLRPYVPDEGGVLADLGGGTGELGAGVAHELAARAIIIDPTPQMLSRVDARPWVSVHLAPAEAMRFPNGYFDAIICCDAFHHFADQSAAAHEIARVVRPGGGVVVLDMYPTGSGRFWAALERLLGEPAGFKTAVALACLLANHGIIGVCRHERGSGYSFVGAVRPFA